MSAAVTLVLVHGCGTDGRFWDELRPHLSGLAVLTPSLPGRADSGVSPLDSAEANAEWVFERLRESSIDNAIVVGHSFGGAIAIEMALRERSEGVTVRGLGLIATGARLRVLPQILAATAEAAESGVPAELGRFAYHESTDPALIDRVESRSRQTPPATTKQDWLSTNAFDRLGQLGAIQVPTVVVGGTTDLLTPPKYAQYLAENINGSELVVLEDVGHMLPVERPAELAATLRDLVSRCEQGGGE